MKNFFKGILLVLTVLLITNSCSKDDEGPYSGIENEIANLVNQHRASIGKSNLQFNSVIYREAKGHSNNMAAGTVPYSHDGSTDRFNKIGTEFGGTVFGENIATGYKTAKAAYDAWMASTQHKSNIEGDFNYAAIAVSVSSNGTNFFTHIFVKK